jgi:hypothetical protein
MPRLQATREVAWEISVSDSKSVHPTLPGTNSGAVSTGFPGVD